MTIRRLSTDVLILGAGGAGLFAALHAHQANPALSITVAVKGLLGKCGCTRMVQGGYNVALAPGDSVDKHFRTRSKAAWLADQDLAWTLVTHAVGACASWKTARLLFDRNRRHDPSESLCRSNVRPHRSQGGLDRHRDHEPAR
jgi:succinate dehydrogenase/fumarate reductase flavoprotein subunit